MCTPKITAIATSAGQGRLVVPSSSNSCSSLAGVWQREQCAAAQRRPAAALQAEREQLEVGRTPAATQISGGAPSVHTVAQQE